MQWSSKLLCGTSIAIVFLATIASAQAYSRPTNPSDVSVVGCYANGGVRTVPAETPITVFGGWEASNRGQVIDWLNATSNTINVDGGQVIDLTPYFAGLTQDWDVNNPDNWADIFFFPISELAVGQSETVAWTYTSSRGTPDGSYAGNPGGAHSFTFTCTMIGVGA
jgi:hypothetical protein